MSYSGPVILYNCDGWTLESYGRGAAYTLRHSLPGEQSESCFFQGDDADSFRAEIFGDDGFLIDAPWLHNAFCEYSEVMQPDDALQVAS